MRRGRLILVIAAVAVAALVLVPLVLLGGDDEERARRAPAVAPGRDVEVVVQDDAQLREAPPEQIRAAAQRLAALGVDRIRFTGSWVGLAPDPQAARRPAFDASDPAAYSADGWLKLDTAIVETVRAGMKPMIDVSFWAPRWAVERASSEPDQGRWRPSPEAFGEFAGALATRYSGAYVDPVTGVKLPPVRLWTTWNEPNHPAFLLPQWERRDGRWLPASPHIYRAMHEAGYAAIKQVDPANQVLLGGLSSVGTDHPGVDTRITPLRFLRELACVDARLRPLRRSECRDFRPLQADGFAIHPYGFSLPPDGAPAEPGVVTMARLPELTGLLAALHRRGRTEQALPVYVTELGWETNPPDFNRGVPPDAQARYLSQSMWMAWQRPDVRMIAQYLLRDIPVDPAAPPGSRASVRTFQTGVEFADGTPKPALTALELPLWIDAAPDGAGYRAWGRVSPGDGARRVAFERLRPDGSWATVGASLDTKADGTVEQTLREPGTYRMRWAAPAGSRWSLPVATPAG
jgi:hypothetical protein